MLIICLNFLVEISNCFNHNKIKHIFLYRITNYNFQMQFFDYMNFYVKL